MQKLIDEMLQAFDFGNMEKVNEIINIILEKEK